MPAARQTMIKSPKHLTSLTSLSASEVRSMCHQELREEGGGFGSFYVALSDVICISDECTGNDRSSSTRDRKPAIQFPEYETSDGLSSSPVPDDRTSRNPIPTSSPYQPSSQDDDDFEAQLDRTRNEVVSPDLAAQFISSVLDLFLSPTHAQTRGQSLFRIEFSKEPTTFKLNTDTLSCTCTCEDDGSIVQRRKQMLPNSNWSGTKVHLCSLEAKAKYSQTDANSGQPTVSDRVLAQLTCEILGSLVDHISDSLKNHTESLNDHIPSKNNLEELMGRSAESFLDSYRRLGQPPRINYTI
jgi:hypothetical protein